MSQRLIEPSGVQRALVVALPYYGAAFLVLGVAALAIAVYATFWLPDPEPVTRALGIPLTVVWVTVGSAFTWAWLRVPRSILVGSDGHITIRDARGERGPYAADRVLEVRRTRLFPHPGAVRLALDDGEVAYLGLHDGVPDLVSLVARRNPEALA